jgi:hypothetical protein
MTKTLVAHDEIRQWSAARGGNPLSMDVPDGTRSRTLLEITFGQHALNADSNEGPDRATAGYELVGWDEWFAEFDRQALAIKVRDEEPGQLDNDFEFVPRAEAKAKAKR